MQKWRSALSVSQKKPALFIYIYKVFFLHLLSSLGKLTLVDVRIFLFLEAPRVKTELVKEVFTLANSHFSVREKLKKH